MHSQKIIYKKENFQYSIVSVFGFLIMIIFGFSMNGSESKLGEHILDPNSYFYQAFWYVYTPLSATMFALLAFYVASASYRAFRIRNFEATLLLLSGIILMIGRVPIGQQIPWWFVIILYVMGMTAMLAMLITKRKNIFIAFIGLLSFSFVVILFIDKENVILQIAEKNNFSETSKKFLCFIATKNRLFFLNKIIESFLNLVSNNKGELKARLVSSKKLSIDEQKKIQFELSKDFKSPLNINFEYDPDLIAGLIIQVGSVMVDTSIKTKLRKLEKNMIEA